MVRFKSEKKQTKRVGAQNTKRVKVELSVKNPQIINQKNKLTKGGNYRD